MNKGPTRQAGFTPRPHCQLIAELEQEYVFYNAVRKLILSVCNREELV